mgnify:CR=1 FL=1
MQKGYWTAGVVPQVPLLIKSKIDACLLSALKMNGILLNAKLYACSLYLLNDICACVELRDTVTLKELMQSYAEKKTLAEKGFAIFQVWLFDLCNIVPQALAIK